MICLSWYIRLEKMENFTFEVFYGLVMLVLLIAVFGSALTISSVVYAKRNKKFNFDGDEWLKSIIFILNLAWVNIIYCILYFTHFVYASLIYLQYDVGNTSSTCQFLVLGIQNIACVSGWSIALIAFSKSFPKYRYIVQI